MNEAIKKEIQNQMAGIEQTLFSAHRTAAEDAKEFNQLGYVYACQREATKAMERYIKGTLSQGNDWQGNGEKAPTLEGVNGLTVRDLELITEARAKIGEAVPVPVSVAKQIAERFEKDQVIILCYDARSQLTWTTTYGVTGFDKENAAAAGELATKALGNDLSQKQTFEDFHKDYDPALYKEAKELLRKVNELYVVERDGDSRVQDEVGAFLKRVGFYPEPKKAGE